MRAITKRLEALEDASGLKGGWDIRKPCHVILMNEDGTHADGLRDYMAKNPDRAVAGDDNVFWIVLCSPKFDVAGERIFRNPDQDKREDNGPSLAEVLKELEAA